MSSWKEKASRIIASTLIHLAGEDVVSDTIDELLVYLSKVTPSELYELAVNNRNFGEISEEDREGWKKRILVGAKAAIKFRQVELANKMIQEQVNPQKVITKLVEQALKTDNKRALENLNFIINEPVVLKWYSDKVSEVREWILQTFNQYVRENS
jgi:DNA polymerase III delta prime subunit